MTPANDLREALARVVSDQRRDADLIINDIYTVLREYGREAWEVHNGYGLVVIDSSPLATHRRVLVLPLPDEDSS